MARKQATATDEPVTDVISAATDAAATKAALRREEIETKAAIDRDLYAGILARHLAGQSTKEDAERLADVLDSQSITPAELQEDLASLKRAVDITKGLAEAEALVADYQSATADLRALGKRHAEELKAARRRWSKCDHANSTRNDRRAELVRMSKSRAWLFSNPNAEPLELKNGDILLSL